jgi:adenylate cyclase
VVNLAARLCSQAEAGEILVDQKVYAAVEAEVDAEPAGELTLKGLSRAIKAFNIKTLAAA